MIVQCYKCFKYFVDDEMYDNSEEANNHPEVEQFATCPICYKRINDSDIFGFNMDEASVSEECIAEMLNDKDVDGLFEIMIDYQYKVQKLKKEIKKYESK